jgi:hypothetical protein
MARGHNTIKTIVIGLGAVIVGLTILVVMVIIDKAGDSVTGTEAPVAETAGYADVAVALPAGAQVMTMAGGGDALSLLVRLADGSQRIVTVDRRSGEVLGTLELMPRNP